MESERCDRQVSAIFVASSNSIMQHNRQQTGERKRIYQMSRPEVRSWNSGTEEEVWTLIQPQPYSQLP
jgi:hypothetical protein